MIALPLVALDVLVIALWTIAAALAIALIMDKLAAVLDAVPGIGGWLASHVRSMAQAITNACGHLLSGIDHLIGAAWSHLSHYLNTMFSQFVAHSAVIAHLAQIVAGSLYRVSGLKGLVHQLSKAVHVVLHRFTEIGREIYRLRHRVHKLEREIAQGIGDDVLPRIKTLEREYAHIENGVIPALRDAVGTADAAIDNLYEWAKGKAQLLGVGSFAMAVATALGVLGLDWIKCKEGKNLYNQRGCAMWSDLGQLLGIAFIAAEVANLDELIHVAQTVTEDVVKGVETLLDV